MGSGKHRECTTWASLAEAWLAAPTWTPERTREFLLGANEQARSDPKAFWDWFLTLRPEARVDGSLVAKVLQSWSGAAPVPKRAFLPMLCAAVEEPDPSFNRTFVDPCVRAYGGRATVEALLRILEEGTSREKAGAANALYWAGSGDDDLGSVRGRQRQVLLREFIETEDLDVRRAIVGKLSLEAEHYPEEMRPLVAKAIEIARRSDDAYLKSRIEVQLGNGGALMALPHGGPKARAR